MPTYLHYSREVVSVFVPRYNTKANVSSRNKVYSDYDNLKTCPVNMVQTGDLKDAKMNKFRTSF